MAKQLIPLVKSGYLASPGYIPLVHGNGLTTNVEPEPQYETLTGDIVTFNSLRVQPLEALSCTITPVQSGSGDPSPQNVRPISGWSEAKVTDDPLYGGMIEFNQKCENGDFSENTKWLATNGSISIANNAGTFKATAQNGYAYHAVNDFVNGHKYFRTADLNVSDTTQVTLNVAGVFPLSVASQTGWQTLSSIITWSYADGNYQIRITDNRTSGWTDVLIKNVMVFDLTQMFGAGSEPSTVEEFKAMFPLDYYAYNAGTVTNVSAVSNLPYRQITIDLSGTRYGGTLDVKTGVLTVTHGMVDLGTVNWSIGGAQGQLFFTTNITNKAGGSGVCSVYPVTDLAPNSLTAGQSTLANANRFFVYNDGTYADATAFKTAMSGQTLVYELATPLSVQLTANELSTLLGQNNIWSTTGQSTVTYQTN